MGPQPNDASSLPWAHGQRAGNMSDTCQVFFSERASEQPSSINLHLDFS